jgi:C-terminal processing protease CtpA/Prc
LRQADLDPQDLDQVGLTLEAKGGAYFVSAIATQKGKPTVEGVDVGDKLLQIGGLQTKAATRGMIYEAMHGKPGELRALLLERNGKQFTIHASVMTF